MTIFTDWALGHGDTPFPGIDGITPDEAGKGSIWIFGVEPGFSAADSQALRDGTFHPIDTSYPVSTQIKWAFNRKCFKLLAAISGHPIENQKYKFFVSQFRPFELGSSGFVKGNLFPVAANTIKEFTERQKQECGFETKEDYYKWCRKHRLPLIRQWIDTYQPRIVIGVGLLYKEDFAAIIGAGESELVKKQFIINGHTKTLYTKVGRPPLLIVPHLTGGPDGLNSHASIQEAAKIANRLLKSSDKSCI